MRRALEVAQASDYEISIVDLCGEIDLNRRTWYEYFDNPTFVKWWNEQVERHFGLKLPGVYRALQRAAEGEDGICNRVRSSAAKLLLERFDRGYAPKTRQEHSGEVPLKTYINVNVDRAVGREKEIEDDPPHPAGANDPGSPAKAGSG